MAEFMDRVRERLGRPRAATRLARTDKVDCTVVSTVMHAYLDGELDAEHEPLVRAHLDDCDRCGLDADVHRAVIARLGAARQAVDPEALGRLNAFAAELVEGTGSAPA